MGKIELSELLARELEKAALSEKKLRDSSANRQQYLMLMAERAGYGTDVEGYIKYLKSMQPGLEPMGFWEYPDPSASLGTTEAELNPKGKRTSVKSKTTGRRIDTSEWDRLFNPKNRR